LKNDWGRSTFLTHPRVMNNIAMCLRISAMRISAEYCWRQSAS